MSVHPFINEEHGYYRISKDNISLLIENYCQELGDNFIVYIDKDNDFDNFRNVTELITSALEQKQLEYKIGDMPIDRCIEWLAQRGRVENDYYATPFNATESLIVDGLQECFLGSTILEPAAGEGHIVKVLDTYYPDCKIIANDLVERKSKFGYKINGDIDFLTYEPTEKIDTVITNPPFKLAQEFVKKGLSIAKKYVIIFAKIQFLEGEKRRKLFEQYPPHYVYVFSKRVNPLRNGEETDENGKKLSTVMCFAWFVWEIGYTGDTIIKWL